MIRYLIICFFVVGGMSLPAKTVDQNSAYEAFFDNFFDQNFVPSILPGVTVAVADIKGEVFLKGYGDARLAMEPVSPSETIFKIGSVSKVFAATLLLQLVEEGKVLLGDDVNQHLNAFHVKNKGGQPLLVENLLNHSSGLDGDLTFMVTEDPSKIAMSALQIQSALLPARKPGVVIAYDNLAVGILGLIVSEKYQMPYEEVLAQRILSPLRMKNTFVGAGAPEQQARMADCHAVTSPGVHHRCRVQYIRELMAPAGDMSSTADDMSRFLKMLIGRGKYEDKIVLSEASYSRLADTRSGRFHPNIHGFGGLVYGIGPIDSSAFAHGGEIQGYNSSLFVMPEEGIGVFVAANASAPDGPDFVLSQLIEYAQSPAEEDTISPSINVIMYADLPELFINRFGNRVANSHLVEEETIQEIPVSELVGQYASPRATMFSSFLGRFLTPLVSDTTSVTSNQDGTLMIGEAGPYVQRGSNYFERAESDQAPWAIRQFGFVKNKHGIFMGSHALLFQEKLRWYNSLWVTHVPFVVSIIVLTGAGAALLLSRNRRGLGLLLLICAVCFTLSLTYEMEYAKHVLIDENATLGLFLSRLLLNASIISLLAIAIYMVCSRKLRWKGWLANSAFLLCAVIFSIMSVFWRLLGSF